MSFKSIAAYCVALFVMFLGLVSPVFAQEESKTHELQLTLKWPAAASDQIYVLLMPDGGNCEQIMQANAEESEAYDVAHGQLYGGLTWMNRSNVNSKLGVGEAFTLCTYEKDQHGRLIYVPLSMVLDMPYQAGFEYTPVLPSAPPVAPPDTKRPAREFEPTSTVLIGTTVFPAWQRLTPLVGFMVVPRSVQLGTSQFALEPIAYGTFLVDNPSAGGTMTVIDLGAGALVGMQTYRKVQLHGDAGLMLGYGPAVWGCSSNTVSNPDDLFLTCHSGDAAITLRQQVWWFAPTLALSADIPVGKEGLRLGLGVTSQVRAINGYDMYQNMSKLQVEVVASDGNTYTAHYELANRGWLVTVPIIVGIKIIPP